MKLVTTFWLIFLSFPLQILTSQCAKLEDNDPDTFLPLLTDDLVRTLSTEKLPSEVFFPVPSRRVPNYALTIDLSKCSSLNLGIIGVNVHARQKVNLTLEVKNGRLSAKNLGSHGALTGSQNAEIAMKNAGFLHIAVKSVAGEDEAFVHIYNQSCQNAIELKISKSIRYLIFTRRGKFKAWFRQGPSYPAWFIPKAPVFLDRKRDASGASKSTNETNRYDFTEHHVGHAVHELFDTSVIETAELATSATHYTMAIAILIFSAILLCVMRAWISSSISLRVTPLIKEEWTAFRERKESTPLAVESKEPVSA